MRRAGQVLFWVAASIAGIIAFVLLLPLILACAILDVAYQSSHHARGLALFFALCIASAHAQTIPPSTSLIDPAGTAWSLKSVPVTAQNTTGTSVQMQPKGTTAPVIAGVNYNVVQIVMDTHGAIYHKNTAGQYWKWSGTTWVFSAPAPIPGVAPVVSVGGVPVVPIASPGTSATWNCDFPDASHVNCILQQP